jgi:N-acetylated-alpha-linked acidic dipeptidase
MSIEEYALYDRDEPAVSGVERSIHDAVSREEPWALVERFADLERVSGSADERRAAQYLTGRLDALGIPYDRHEPELRLSVPEDAALTAGDESFDAVKTVAFSASGGAAGSLLLADEGDGDGDLDDLLSADVSGLPADLSGRVVVLQGLLPIGPIREVEQRGAEAVVVVHPHEREPHEGIATPVWGGVPDPDGDLRSPDVPVVVAARPVGERLAERGDGTAVEVRAETDTGWEVCPLVVVRVEAAGDGAGERDDFVLAHGHYDSWHVGVADNATGDAALLELARVLHDHRADLRRDCWVAWWPGHSTGRYAGSTWFADAFGPALAERCVAQVNVDSPGAVDATEFEDMAVWMPEAETLCTGAICDVAGKEADGDRPPRAGDYSFDNLGVSGAFMLSSNIPREVRAARGYHPVGGCGGHSDAWHLTTDTLDKADPEVLVRDVRVYATALARLLTADVVPLDHRETVDRHREYLLEYDGAAGEHLDLGPALEALEGLGRALEAFHDAVAAGEVAPADANEAIVAVSRRLVPLSFCTEGRFEQDPATPRPPYPRLAPAADLPDLDDETRRRKQVHLRRQRNHVVHELRRARAAVEAAR